MRKVIETVRKRKGTARDAPSNCQCTFKRYDDGSISYDAPNLLKRCHPFLTDLNPRVETPEKTFSRLLSAIKTDHNHEKHLGLCHGGKWILRATEGYRALFSRGSGQDATTRQDLTETSWNDTHTVMLDNPEIYLVVRRSLIMAPGMGKRILVTIQDGTFTVRSEGPGIGDFEETLPILHNSPLRFLINGLFLKSALGSWPLVLMAPKTEWPEIVVFKPQDDSWRLTIATMLDKKGDEKNEQRCG